MSEVNFGFSLREILKSYVPEAQWAAAESVAVEQGKRVGDVLLEQSNYPNVPSGFIRVTDEEIAKGLAYYFNLRYESLMDQEGKIKGVVENRHFRELIKEMHARVSPFYQEMYMPMRLKSMPIQISQRGLIDTEQAEESVLVKEKLYVVIALHDPYHLLDMKIYLETIVRDMGYAGIHPVISTPKAIRYVYQKYFGQES